jgi:hypothetical protein
MTGTSNRWSAIAAAALVVAAPLATARAQAGAAPGTLSPAEITRKVEAAGYTNIHDLEYDDGRWELEATSPAGVPVDLDVDAATGSILNEERD